MLKRLLIFSLMLLPGCATSKKPVAPIVWTEVPSAALEALCTNSIRGEGIGRQTPIFVVDHTQALITPASMASVRRAFFQKTSEGLIEGAAMAERIRASVSPLPVSVPTDSVSCTWKPMTKYDAPRDYDKMILQLSSPFANPYAKNEYGLFGRLSVGGQSAQWYWVPLAMSRGRLLVEHVLPLDIHEN